MIPIKIQGKPYKIKSISELTTKEFLELATISELDTVKYIAWQTGVDMKDAFFAVTSKTVELAIGQIPNIANLARPTWPDYTKTIQTVGQRHQVEASGLKGYALLVFILAVSQARSNNIDDVNALRDSYLEKPFTEVLPAGFFFYKISRGGSNFVQRNLKRLKGLARTKRLKKMQA
jgi:hypothetical protein